MDEPEQGDQRGERGSSTPLPSGSYSVCPRCGIAAGESRWCAGCGLNLGQQAELPTADAYSAKIREGRWLAEQEARQREQWELEEQREREHERREQAQRERDEAQAREKERREAVAQATTLTAQPAGCPPPGRRLRRVGAAALVVLLTAAGAVAVVVATGGESIRRASAKHPVTTATSVAASTPSSETQTLVVERCPSTYGTASEPTIPSSLPAKLAPALARTLVFYANGGFAVLAPRGWQCKGAVGVDGSASITVTLGGATTQAVSAQGGGACVGCNAAIACPLFSSAAATLPVQPCPTSTPPNQTTTRLSSTTVAFEDPPAVTGTGTPSGGPNPANGIMIYRGDQALAETCTLPQSEHSLCTAVLNDFLYRYHGSSGSASNTSGSATPSVSSTTSSTTNSTFNECGNPAFYNGVQLANGSGPDPVEVEASGVSCAIAVRVMHDHFNLSSTPSGAIEGAPADAGWICDQVQNDPTDSTALITDCKRDQVDIHAVERAG